MFGIYSISFNIKNLNKLKETAVEPDVVNEMPSAEEITDVVYKSLENICFRLTKDESGQVRLLPHGVEKFQRWKNVSTSVGVSEQIHLPLRGDTLPELADLITVIEVEVKADLFKRFGVVKRDRYVNEVYARLIEEIVSELTRLDCSYEFMDGPNIYAYVSGSFRFDLREIDMFLDFLDESGDARDVFAVLKEHYGEFVRLEEARFPSLEVVNYRQRNMDPLVNKLERDWDGFRFRQYVDRGEIVCERSGERFELEDFGDWKIRITAPDGAKYQVEGYGLFGAMLEMSRADHLFEDMRKNISEVFSQLVESNPDIKRLS
ncbi:hypothetical protein KJ764_00370 [Patescibacteria group bacterium]|nr:hypothetical protein [Patescibacteria group bacterium]